MSKENFDYNLRDFIWEEEEISFNPKVNHHKKNIRAKRRQLNKEAMAANKPEKTPYEYERYCSKVEAALLQDYYDRDDLEDEDYSNYKIR